MKSLPFAIAALVFAAACGGPALAHAAQDASEHAVFTVADDGMLVHSGSSLRFPETVAGFTRTAAKVFNQSGQYIGVQYAKPLAEGAQITLRIAVVNIGPMTPREHYAATRPVALQDLAEANPVVEGAFRGASGLEGYRGIFAGMIDGRPWTAGLWAFERGPWDLRVRADFPEDYRPQADAAVGDFVKALNQLNPPGN